MFWIDQLSRRPQCDDRGPVGSINGGLVPASHHADTYSAHRDAGQNGEQEGRDSDRDNPRPAEGKSADDNGARRDESGATSPSDGRTAPKRIGDAHGFTSDPFAGACAVGSTDQPLKLSVTAGVEVPPLFREGAPLYLRRGTMSFKPHLAKTIECEHVPHSAGCERGDWVSAATLTAASRGSRQPLTRA
jgi:hypothetical protein